MDTLRLRLLDASYQPPLVTVAPNTPVVEAIHLMSQAHTSCVLVLEQQKLVNIFTERDVVRAIANKINFAEMTIAELILQPVITLSETEVEDLNTVLQLFRQHHISHLPVIDGQGKVLGVLTPLSVRDALQPSDLLKLRTVADVMETNVISAPAKVAVETLAHLMTSHQISSVVIVSESQAEDSALIPIGIITERDIVKFQSQGLDLVSTIAGEVMSDRLVTVAPEDTLWSAYQRMQSLEIRRLVVTGSDRELLGIITQSIVLQALDPIKLCKVITVLQQIIDSKKAELAQEITQRQQISQVCWEREAHYRASEARLNDILNSAIANSIVSFRVFSNHDWEYEYQSPGCEAIFGYTAGEIIQDKHLWRSRVHPQDVETVIMPLFADILAGITTSVEFRFAHKNGSLRWISATYTSRHDPENNCWIATGISKDITDRKQAEIALRKSEERWQLAIAGTNEAIWDWDILTNKTFRSDRWFEMLGYEGHELSNWDDEWSKRLHPDDYERVMAAQEAYLSGQTPVYSCEYRLRLQDGSYGWFKSRAKAVWDEQGNAIRLVGSLGDIGDYKTAEIALQQSEAMLRRIGDNLPNGAIYQVVRELDGSDRFSYLSAGIEKLMEVKAEDALQDSSLLYRQFIGEDNLRLEAAVNESMHDLSVFDIQLQICTPSKQVKWLHFRSSPHKWPDGRIVWDGLVVGITNIKHIEATLRKSQAFLAESQRVARLGCWEFDLATQKIIWSEELFRLFNLDPTQTEPTYQENLELYHPEDRAKLEQAVNQAIITGESYKLLLRKLTPDDTVTYIESIGYAEFNADGQVVRLYGTAQDITERIQAEEKLRHSEARLITTQKIAHVGSWELDLNTYQRSWSKEAFQIFGLNPHQVEPTHTEFLEMVHPDDRAIVQTQLEQAIAHSIPFSLEYRIIRPDGSMRYVESRAEVAKDSQGKVAQLLGAILDITERKQAELEIIYSRDLREAIFNESADALFLVDPVTFLTTDCNQQALKMFGVSSKAELIGIEGYTFHKQPLQPEEIATCAAQIDQLGFWHREIEYLSKQGNVFWGSLVMKRIRVAGQEMNLVRVTDISEQQAVLRDRQQAEAALARSEEQLRLTFEFTNIGTWDWNVQTGEVVWNDNHYRLLGLDPTSSTKQYQIWRNAIHPEDVNRVEQALLSALQHRTNYETEYRIIHADASIRWLIGRGRGIYDTVGQPIRMLGVIIDTSEQQAALRELKRAEQALQEKEQFLRSIYDGVGESIFVIDVQDDVFRYVGLNPTHEKLTGLHSSDLQGKTPEQVLPPEVAMLVQQHYQDCVDAGETITYEECLRFQGQLNWWITSLTPLRDETSRIYRIIGNSLNISDRKHYEQMLELQAVITRNMAEGICLVRINDGMIVYTNPKFDQTFGYDAGELIGHHVSILNYEDHQITATGVHQAIASVVKKQGEATYEVQNIKKDGTLFWCSANTSVFDHPDYGTVLVAVQQDITEQKQVAETIKASLKEKEVLLQEIHHRVKNNLGIVSSLLQMQYRRTQDSPATAILLDSQNRIASIALVHEKLYRSDDLANIDFAQYIPDLTTHLFDSYNVSSTHIQLKIQVENVNLDIETAIPCGLIINELVSNALKYAFSADRAGEIQVSLSQATNQTLILIVRDNGVGLPAEFDSKKTKTLGMTLIQGLVKQLRGSLEINIHQGTEFKIYFTATRV
ncbi:PAS domain-containing protein [Anabaena sp. CCY 9402-a]|uniref:PAS domain-containing protein n=1 Tax=Anabaena sp. CCY 9402-a TaxID=3103867 RepID=UPI0039C721B4